MLFECQGILQFISQSGFSFDSVFFCFTVLYCFMAILKTSAGTNVRQSLSLTHCIKNLHSCNLKSLTFTAVFSNKRPSTIPFHIRKYNLGDVNQIKLPLREQEYRHGNIRLKSI